MSDKLYVIRHQGGISTCIDEAKARQIHADRPGSTLGWQPFPSPVKMPWIGKDYTIVADADCWAGTFTPLGVTGYGVDYWDAYKGMLRAIRAHLEAQTETPLET